MTTLVTVTTDRPLRADARRNRAKVLEAAAAAFAAEGPGVPLDEIARRAGVGAGTVYRHFPTKEALLEAVVVERLREMVDHVHAALEAEEPGAAFFAFFAGMIADAGAKLDLAEALERFGVDIHSSTRGVAAELTAVLGDLLKRAQEAGAVRPDADVADLHALALGAVAATRRSGRPGETARVTELMCDALRPRD